MRVACKAILCLGLALAGVGPPRAAEPPEPPAHGASSATTLHSPSLPAVWRSDFEDGLRDWKLRHQGWGVDNRRFVVDAARPGKVLQVFIPSGSIDPATMRLRLRPYGGTGFKSMLPGAGFEQALLRYWVRFPADFEPARGGKLPGLCGGACNGGGRIPNGCDGFSTRYMWLAGMRATVYAYLPTSVNYGTSIGHDRLVLPRGRWVNLAQEVTLNTPGQADGRVRVWIDGVLAVDDTGFVFRSTHRLKVDAIYFDIFYGGSNDTWAAPKDAVVEFSSFEVFGR